LQSLRDRGDLIYKKIAFKHLSKYDSINPNVPRARTQISHSIDEVYIQQDMGHQAKSAPNPREMSIDPIITCNTARHGKSPMVCQYKIGIFSLTELG
jgi:hypothetical protein